MTDPTAIPWEWDIVADDIRWTEQCRAEMGTEEFEGTFKDFLALVHPDDRSYVEGRVRRSLDERTFYDAEFRVIDKDGHTRWITAFGVPEFSQDLKPVRLYGTVRDVTEVRRADAQIRRSEENFRSLVKASTLLTWEVDRDGRGEELFSWLSELSGQPVTGLADLRSIVHPEDVDQLLAELKRSASEKKMFSAVARLRSREGGFKYLAVRAVQVFNDDGSFRQWIGTFNDITERKAAEEDLKRSEALNRAVLNSVTSNIVVLDRNGIVSAINQPWKDTVSFDPELLNCTQWSAAVGANFLQLCRESSYGLDDPQSVADGIAEVIAGRKVGFTREFEISTATAKWTFLLNATRLKTREGGAVVALTDLTENKKTETALLKNQTILQLVADTVPTAIGYLDTDCVFRFANRACCQWFMSEMGNIVGHHMSKVVGTDLFEAVQREIEAVISGKELRFERASIKYPDRYVQLNYTPDLDGEGNVIGFFLFITDLTESRLAEERLRKSEEQLRQAQKLESIGRLAGGIAHDFNNMLTAINGYSELSLLQLPEDSPIRRNIHEIKKAGERSAHLTQQLLAFSRRQLIEVSLIDLNRVVEDSLVMLQRVIGEDIQIVTDLESDLERVNGDTNQLTQILLNLVVNSRDAMPRGGTITLSTRNDVIDYIFTRRRPGSKEGKYVVLSVADTGTGIDPETQKHIFEPFFTTKETGKGTGLGLSMVYGIVKQLEGYVWVTSETNGGTTFDIYFPRSGVSEDPVVSEIDLPHRFTGTENVLLVEDEPIVRELSRRVLESCGYAVTEADNGAEALAIFKANGKRFDLLMTDVVMPEMSGEELAEAITALEPGIKVLFTSGYLEDPVPIRKGIQEGAHFLQKPFTFDGLAKTVRSILDEREA